MASDGCPAISQGSRESGGGRSLSTMMTPALSSTTAPKPYGLSSPGPSHAAGRAGRIARRNMVFHGRGGGFFIDRPPVASLAVPTLAAASRLPEVNSGETEPPTWTKRDANNGQPRRGHLRRAAETHIPVRETPLRRAAGDRRGLRVLGEGLRRARIPRRLRRHPHDLAGPLPPGGGLGRSGAGRPGRPPLHPLRQRPPGRSGPRAGPPSHPATFPAPSS